MNKIAIIVLLFVLTIPCFGQEFSKLEKIERIRAQKVAFITSRLNLSSKEAERFWPVYNEFFEKKEKLSDNKKALTKELQQNGQNYTNDKKIQLADELITFKLKEAKLDQIYHEKFKMVLSIDKIIRLYNAENKFKNQLLMQIRNKNSSNSNRNYKRQ